jgi:AraC-like DNA-binding protein
VDTRDWKERTFRALRCHRLERPARKQHISAVERTMNPAIASAARTFSLARFVESVRTIAPGAGDPLDLAQLPDGRTVLVFRVLAGGRHGDVAVKGPRTRALFKHSSGVTRALMISFKPGWSASLFGVAANTLTDRIVRLEELWGRPGVELYDALAEARSVPQMLGCLSHAIAHRMGDTFEPSSARLARQAVRMLEADQVRVESVADRLGVSSRHLRRAFNETIGIGPKQFARSVRIQRAVSMAASSNDWARIAMDAGYYDQAHLIADFRDLIGLTPGAFVKRSQEPHALVG